MRIIYNSFIEKNAQFTLKKKKIKYYNIEEFYCRNIKLHKHIDYYNE